MSNSKNDIAWNLLFEKYDILNKINTEGVFKISSDEINEFRESRLMTKFDHKSQLPQIFADNNLSVLPVSRGDYLIGRFDSYYKLEESESEIVKITPPIILESINFNNITSEAAAINAIAISTILNDFVNEQTLYSTVNGRMSSSMFDYDITNDKQNYHISVVNAQIEIDGGFEGNNCLYILEAKNYIVDNFLIRQLYYPFRLWRNKIIKEVKPIFLTYSNGIYHLRAFSFADANHYNSIQLDFEKKYQIYDGVINTEYIIELLSSTNVIEERNIPFPQANNFERIINLCEILYVQKEITNEDITNNYDFDKRQTNYYTSAAIYLNLIYKEGNVFKLTTIGDLIFKSSLFDRQRLLIKLILEHNIFRLTIQLYLDQGTPPSKEQIVNLMTENNLYNINSESTYIRRSSTIISWINWIISLIEE